MLRQHSKTPQTHPPPYTKVCASTRKKEQSWKKKDKKYTNKTRKWNTHRIMYILTNMIYLNLSSNLSSVVFPTVTSKYVQWNFPSMFHYYLYHYYGINSNSSSLLRLLLHLLLLLLRNRRNRWNYYETTLLIYIAALFFGLRTAVQSRVQYYS